MWEFRKITTIEEPVFNNVLERFYNLGLDGLVRENIQNSLDGKLKGSNMPVEVKIKTGDIPASEIPGIDEIKRHIQSLKGENSYTKETIAHMKKEMEKEIVPFISFEDSNTKGLTGAEYGENFQEGDTWGVYAYKKGVHFTEHDDELEKTRGGSHGVGKIACNAASDIYMMFFANCDVNGKQYIGGTTQLIEHNLDGNNYRASGYFTKVEKDTYFPFENHFAPVFQKNTRGLKIIIPYLRTQYIGEENAIRSVCDNFFVAILQKKLVVYVNDYEINNKTICRIVSDPEMYPEQNFAEMKNCFTPLYINTYFEKEPILIKIQDKNTEYNFRLYLQYEEEIKRARVAVVRGIGMKIEDKKIKGYVNSPFNGVLIPVSSEEDIFLKSLENESHTSLSCDHIKDIKIQENAKRFLNNISNIIGKVFAEVLKSQNPSDGKIDTSEVLYSMERNFRKELSKEISTVQLTKSNLKNPKIVVKVKGNSKKDKRQEKKKREERQLQRIINKITRKSKYEEGDQKKEISLLPMEPEAVKRVVLREKELLQFDFKNVTAYDGETVCNISMVVIDGTGKPYEKEFDLSKNYLQIMDTGQKSLCNIKDNKIKNVSIVDGKIQLEMKVTDYFNSSLKFMYYVEV